MLVLSGCALIQRSPDQRTKARLYDAYCAYQAGDERGALHTIQRALTKAPQKKLPGYVLVDLYDDAGLYFYINGWKRESFIRQSVAVLLSRVIDSPDEDEAVLSQQPWHGAPGLGFRPGNDRHREESHIAAGDSGGARQSAHPALLLTDGRDRWACLPFPP
jgi:hypothetical protein